MMLAATSTFSFALAQPTQAQTTAVDPYTLNVAVDEVSGELVVTGSTPGTTGHLQFLR